MKTEVPREQMKPFLKWAGGKRWLVGHENFQIPQFSGRYIEPFLGGGAVFFHTAPKSALLSDTNSRLVDTYNAIREDWSRVWETLKNHQCLHSKEYYYKLRAMKFTSTTERAAQFLYLNRACWNGLYRENLSGQFNVPIGTKTKIIMDDDDFEGASKLLRGAEIRCCDFSEAIREASEGDFLFVDPPYTTAHNMNGFVKYNQTIFRWEDQVRLRNDLKGATRRGAKVVLTNAHHESLTDLYRDHGTLITVPRASIISGKSTGRSQTEELLIYMPRET